MSPDSGPPVKHGRNARFQTPIDVGLQPERTFLAWTRTTCSLAIVGLLGLRWIGEFGAVAVFISLGPAAVLGLLLGLTRLRERRLAWALNEPLESAVPAAPAMSTAQAPPATSDKGAPQIPCSDPSQGPGSRHHRPDVAVIVTVVGVAAIGALSLIATVLR